MMGMRPLQSILLLFGLFVSAATAADKPRNVLLILSDDLNVGLGCYGHPLVKSPNIDKLASMGVRFEHAYCQFPLCSPSRSSFLSGRKPNENGVLRNPGKDPGSDAAAAHPHIRDLIPDTVTLPQLFKNAGYFSARVGKAYHYGVPGDIGTSSLDDPASWNAVVNPRGLDKDVEDEIQTIAPPGSKGAGRFGGTLSWLSVADDRGEHTDGIGAAEGIKLLEAHKDKPFFLTVGFYRPHTPYVAPKKYFDLYPLDKITLPTTPEGFKEQTPPLAITSNKAQDNMTDQQRKEAIQAYYAATSYMDAQVGRVLDAVERLGLAENTVIVFTSDHGYHLGEYGMWQKQSLFEQSAGVPLIIANPGAKNNGRSSAALAELLDIYPTLADICGLKSPDYLDGESLKPILDGSKTGVRAAAYTQVMRGQVPGLAVRTLQYRYIEWDYGDKGVQLYDMEKDPQQTKNLAHDPAYAEIRAMHHELCEERWPKDQWPVMEKKKDGQGQGQGKGRQ